MALFSFGSPAPDVPIASRIKENDGRNLSITHLKDGSLDIHANVKHPTDVLLPTPHLLRLTKSDVDAIRKEIAAVHNDLHSTSRTSIKGHVEIAGLETLDSDLYKFLKHPIGTRYNIEGCSGEESEESLRGV